MRVLAPVVRTKTRWRTPRFDSIRFDIDYSGISDSGLRTGGLGLMTFGPSAG